MFSWSKLRTSQLQRKRVLHKKTTFTKSGFINYLSAIHEQTLDNQLHK